MENPPFRRYRPPMPETPEPTAPILLFDSGVGGLSVLAQLRRLLPQAPVIYAADMAGLPYGSKSEAQIAARDAGGVWPMLMDKEVKRALAMLEAGSPLGLKLNGRLGLELRLVILGGERILKKIHDARGDVLTQRPVLVWKDWLYMVWKALTVPYATKRRRA